MILNRIVPIVLILLAVGLVFGYINPTYTGDIASEQQQIQSYDSALSAAAVFTTKENQLIAERNAIPADSLARLNSYLPDGVDNIQLILDLNALAARSGLSLSGFSIQQNSVTTDTSGNAAGSTVATAGATSATPIAAAPSTSGVSLQSSSYTNSLDLSVTALGTYAAFESFLAAAEQSLRPLDVTHLTVKDSTTGVYSYSITFRIYWLK